MRGKNILWLASLVLFALLVFAAGSGGLSAAAASLAAEPSAVTSSSPPDIAQPVALLPQGAAQMAAAAPVYGPGDGVAPEQEQSLPQLEPPAAPGRPSSGSKPPSTAPAPALSSNLNAACSTAGPDGGGYFYQDSLCAGGPTFAWVEISGTGTALTAASWTATGSFQADDEGYASIPLPFAFPFYGKLYTTLYVDANGQVGFDPFASPTFTGTLTIPSPAYPNNRIDIFHADLNLGMITPGGGGKVWYHNDVANQRFIVEYKDAQLYGGLGLAGSFQVMLYQNGDIQVQFLSVSATPNYPGGIENRDGSAGLAYSGAPAGGLAIGYFRPSVTLQATPSVVAPAGGMASVSARVRGRTWTPVNAPDGTSVTFSGGILGAMAPGSAATTGGVAASTFTAGGTCATSEISAGADLGGGLVVTGFARVTTGAGPTYRSGYLSGFEQWSACQSPYVLQGSYVISPSAHLYIEAGTLVQGESGSGIIDLGQLDIVGSAPSPVLFTSSISQPVPGSWNGIAFGDPSHTATGGVTYADLRYAGQTYMLAGDPQNAGILIYNSGAIPVSNSTLRDNLGAGVAIRNGAPATVVNSILNDNPAAGIYVEAASPGISGNSITGSARGVLLDMGSAATVNGNTFQRNQEAVHLQSAGGAIVNNTMQYGGYGVVGVESLATVQANTIVSNTAVGVFLDVGSTGVVVDNTIAGNGSGGLYARSAATTISSNRLRLNSGFGAYLQGSTTSVSGNTITGNVPYGVYISAGSPAISGNTITQNGAAGLYADSAAATIGGNTISGNGAYGAYLANSSGSLSNNLLAGNGTGGVYLNKASTALSGNSIWLNGSAVAAGYGIQAYGGANSLASGNTITGNSGTVDGYGVYANASPLVLSSNVISGNGGGSGNGFGAYVVSTSNARINGGITANNNGGAGGQGYGVYVISSTAILSGTAVSNNGSLSALGHGASIRNSTVAINSCTFSSNKTAGVYADPSAVTMTGATVSGNPGDGIVVWGGATLTITNSLVQGNGAGATGAGMPRGLLYSQCCDNRHLGQRCGCVPTSIYRCHEQRHRDRQPEQRPDHRRLDAQHAEQPGCLQRC